MKWNATFPASWSLPLHTTSFPVPAALPFIRRARHQLFYHLIPTLLILIGVSWASLLVSEQIYQAETNQKISFDQLYADR